MFVLAVGMQSLLYHVFESVMVSVVMTRRFLIFVISTVNAAHISADLCRCHGSKQGGFSGSLPSPAGV
jgi:hypothetical protein